MVEKAYTKHFCQAQIAITMKRKLSSYKKYNVECFMSSSQVPPMMTTIQGVPHIFQ